MTDKVLKISKILLLSLILMVSLLLVQSNLSAQEPNDTPNATIAESVSSKISYQGVLRENGTLVTGTRDMNFRFCSDDACTTQVGDMINMTGVTVSNGLFNIALPIDHSLFNGQALWVEVKVGGTVIGMSEILAAPYALNLKPGAELSDNSVTSIFRAINTNTSEKTRGLYAKTYSTVEDSAALYGHTASESGATYGVYGKSDSASDGSAGVYGTSSYTDTTAKVYGLYGHVNAPNGRALQAVNDATTGQARAIYAKNYSTEGQAVYGHAGATSGDTFGIYGKADSPDGTGVYGYATTTSGANYGIYGKTNSSQGYAGYFEGNVKILSGTLSVPAQNIMIDHPLDPENKRLVHASVEAPEMINMYNGNALLDANGEAVVELPEYFEALNTDIRYQLTPIGGAAPNLYIAEEVANNEFKIAGGSPGLKVSWEVTGVRHDTWAESNPLEVEVQK